MLGWLLVLLAALVAIFWFLGGTDGASNSLGGGELLYVGGLAALVILYMTSLGADYRGRALKALTHAGVWLVLGLILIAGYAYREEFKSVAYRIAGEVLPAGQVIVTRDGQAGERSVRIRRQENGHFVVRAEVNGQAMRLLVDTGASAVVLRVSDAKRIGIDTDALNYSVPVQTANGRAFSAPVRLRSIAIGPIQLNNIDALVAKPGSLNESLLGMSFLKRLRSYEFTGDFLTIRG